MIPIWQMVIGACVGLVVLVLTTRPQALNYHESRESSTDTSRRRRFQAEPGDHCVICLKIMLSYNMTELRCGHAMHTNCYNECIRHSKKCPICCESM